MKRCSHKWVWFESYSGGRATFEGRYECMKCHKTRPPDDPPNTFRDMNTVAAIKSGMERP